MVDWTGVVAIVMLFGGGAAVLIAYSPLGRAIADRIRGRGLLIQDPEVLADLNQLRGEVAELHERLDFAERLLADRSESAR
jgi:hypothetical protein